MLSISLIGIIAGAAALRRTRSELLAARQIIEHMTREQWLFLAELNRELNTTLDYEAVRQKIVELAIPVCADYCALALLNEQNELYIANEAVAPNFAFALDSRNQRGASPRLPVTEDEGPIARTFKLGRPEIVSDVTTLADLFGFTGDKELRLRSAMLMPLISGGEGLGVLICGSFKMTRAFHDSDLALGKQMALHVSKSLQNARLVFEVKQSAIWRAEVVAVVSHDIRNPLTAIELQASLCRQQLEKQSGDEQLLKSVGTIQKASRQILQIVNSLLKVSRIENRARLIERRLESVSDIVREVVETLKPIAAEKSIHLTAQIGPDDAQAVINRDYIMQVILNLLGNAIKFTGNGGTVRVAVESTPCGCEIHVSDTGPGIPSGDLRRIFERFWQAREGEQTGFGLGLAICKAIVDAHGGKIWVKSIVGEGSTFSVALPGSAEGNAA